MAFVAVLLLGALPPKSRRGGGSILIFCCLFEVRKLVGEEGSCGRVKSAFRVSVAVGCDER